MHIPLIIFATGFGSGYSPIASGTVGSAVGVILLFGLYTLWGGPGFPFFLLTISSIIFFLGVFASGKLEKTWGEDPSEIVIDEIVGMWVSALFVPFSLTNLIAAFLLFRLFDIWKPLGIRRLEKLKKGWGVMVDDVAAGVLANLTLQLSFTLLP